MQNAAFTDRVKRRTDYQDEYLVQHYRPLPGYEPPEVVKKPTEFSLADAVVIHGWSLASFDRAHAMNLIQLFVKAGKRFVRIL